MGMVQLSVVIITFNEESQIGRCLDSVKEVADEIIVVDSFSKDRTREICESRGVRFFEHHFEGYSAQKNYANSLASFGFILSLDADEALSDELIASIRKEKADFAFDAYLMNRMVNYCGTWIRHGAWYPDRKIRIFSKQKAYWEGQHVHETIQLGSGSRIGQLKGDIHHYSYTSLEGHIAQFDKFTSISAAELYSKGRKASFLKLYLSPVMSFIKGFFIRLGFLDGHYGILICFVNAFATYMKYAKLRRLWKEGLTEA
jgi:glycosyltransferase involved in cell wall biosynthesis